MPAECEVISRNNEQVVPRCVVKHAGKTVRRQLGASNIVVREHYHESMSRAASSVQPHAGVGAAGNGVRVMLHVCAVCDCVNSEVMCLGQ